MVGKKKNGEVELLKKECMCLPRIHKGPHWLYMSMIDKSRNIAIIRGRLSALTFKSFAEHEMIRLKDLEREMQKRDYIKLLPGDSKETAFLELDIRFPTP